MVETLSAVQPYPGLRPFFSKDAEYFFGRETHIATLYKKLLLRRFIAVVGASGSGKSSLVRAGLQPLLATKKETGWRVYVMRPESAPFRALAEQLLLVDAAEPEVELRRSRLLAMLEYDSDGLVKAVAELGLTDHERVLLVVDQFEELFRYEQVSVNSSLRFIRLLLRTARQRQLPIHVMITIRLDFLGDCARYPGLTDVINDGQYLVPALDRLQRRKAIVQPARLGGKTVAPELVQTLLNDADDAHDQLPVLQHGLMRLWQEAERQHSDSLTLQHYNAIGGLHTALSKHANAIYDGLPVNLRSYAKHLFQTITDLDKQNRGLRRPQQVHEIAKAIGLDKESQDATSEPVELLQVIDHFRAEPACFLLPLVDEALHRDTTIDITHESLIRIWDKLRGNHIQAGWLQEEAQDGRHYSSLVYAANEGDELPPATLRHRLQWWRSRQPNPYWAKRYGGEFERVKAFLDDNKANLERELHKQRLKICGLVVSGLVMIILLFSLWYKTQILAYEQKLLIDKERAKSLERAALEEKDKADRERKIASDKAKSIEKKAQAEAEAELARKRSKLIANRALELATHGEAGLGLTLAMEILSNKNDVLPKAPEAAQAAYAALHNLGVRDFATLQGLTSITWSQPTPNLAFSPNGRTLASANIEAGAYLWNLSSLNPEPQVLIDNRDSILAVAFSPDGLKLVTGGTSKTIRLWNLQDQPSPPQILDGHQTDVNVLSYSPDGGLLASGSQDGAVLLWNLSNIQPDSKLLQSHKNGGSALSFSPDGRFLVLGGGDAVRLWDLAKPEANPQALRGHKKPIRTLSYSPDGHTVASGSEDGTIKVWDLEASEAGTQALNSYNGLAYSLSYSPDGNMLASGGKDGTVQLWDLRDSYPSIPSSLKMSTKAEVRTLAFSPDGSMLAAGSLDQLQIWSALPMSKQVQTLTSVSPGKFSAKRTHEPINRLRFAANGSKIAYTTGDTILGWRLPDGKFVQQLLNDSPLNLCLFDDNTVSITANGRITGVENVSLADNPNFKNAITVSAAAFTPACDAVAVLWQNDELVVFQIRPSWQPRNQWRVNLKNDSPPLLALLDDGQNVIGITSSGDILNTANAHGDIVELEPGRRNVSPVALHATGGLAASALVTRGGSRIVVWKIADKTVISEFLSGELLNAAFSNDGQRLLVAPRGEPLQLWELVPDSKPGNNDAPIGVFGQAEERFIAVAYGPNDQQIAALKEDGSVKLWPIFKTTDELVTFVRDKIRPAPLTDAQRCQYGLLDDKACAAAKP